MWSRSTCYPRATEPAQAAARPATGENSLEQPRPRSSGLYHQRQSWNATGHSALIELIELAAAPAARALRAVGAASSR